jgi:hypothetical protein
MVLAINSLKVYCISSVQKNKPCLFKEYELLKASVDDEPILFIDAMHPTQAIKMSCGWIKKGTDKSIETTGSRTRLNLVGAIDLNNLAAAYVRRYEKVSGDTIQTVLY